MKTNYRVWLTAEPSRVTDPPELIGATYHETDARRITAKALGQDSLRGLAKANTESGVRFYAPGADDQSGSSVEIERV